MKIVGFGVLGVLVLVGLTWVGQGNDFVLYRYFAPRYEQVRRQTFEQSKAYNQGMVQELENLQVAYVQASPVQRDALASVILHRAADFDLEQPTVPADLRAFIASLRAERTRAR